MLDNLTQRLSRVVKTLRGEARLTEANTQEMLREVRMALLEADVALPVVREFVAGSGQGAGRRSRRQPQPRPGPGRRGPQGTDRADGRRPGRRLRRTVAGRAAARRDPDGRPAGRGQDHHHRQAGALAVRGPAHSARPQDRQEESAGGVGRRLPSRRHRAVEGRGRAGRRGLPAVRPQPEARGHRPQRDRPRTPPSLRRADPGHGRPPGHRRGHDARDPRAA